MEGGKRCQWESSGKGRLRGVGEGRYREFNIGEVLLGKEGDRRKGYHIRRNEGKVKRKMRKGKNVQEVRE